MIKINEYRGVSNLVVAELTETVDAFGNVTENYGEVIPLAGVQAISGELAEESEAHYYDNMAAVVIDSEGSDTYTLTVSIPANKTRALIEGVTYDEQTGALIGTPKVKKYFALGFIGDKTDGSQEYNWVYKGKFTGGNKELNTKDDGTDATNMEYTYTSVHTSTKYTKAGNKSCKYLSVSNDGSADLSTFFDQVTTPDDLQSTSPASSYNLAITQAEGTTVSVTRNGSALTDGASISAGDVLTISVTDGTLTVNGESFTSGNTLTVSGNVTVVSTATA